MRSKRKKGGCMDVMRIHVMILIIFYFVKNRKNKNLNCGLFFW